MHRTISAAALAMVGLAASPAHAAEHEVVIIGNGYFPDALYALPGDTVRFVNAADTARYATALDDSWSTGLIPVDEVRVIEVVAGMTKDFDNTMPEGLPLFDATQPFADPAPDEDGSAPLSATTEPVEGQDQTEATAWGILEWESAAPVLLDQTGRPVDLGGL